MHLQKLEINGFKSFANKTELDFTNPITAVVGPNGSGKSNISDAIRWVLGEQGAKTLRGSKMEDVIFAGTANRKALGMAQVSLTLNNTEGTLPIEYDEVKITRSIYRSGESEYYLNKSPCRLKDIRELLMDTGIGKDGYSIIGQGKIDEILSTRSEGRREFFEEAVGIVKYKHRKYDAEKKLKDTKDNLLRIKDILHELEKQLKPLEAQKIQVIKYNELNKELSRLEINFFINEIDKIDHELKHIQEQSNMIAQSLSLQNKENTNHKNELMEIERELVLIENTSGKKQEEYYYIQNMIKTVEGEINLIQQNILHYNESIERVKKEMIDLDSTNNKSRNELSDKKRGLDTINLGLKDLSKRLETNTPKYKEMNKIRIKKEDQVEKFKSEIIDVLNKISNKKADANSLKTLIETMEKQNNQMDTDIGKNKESEKEYHIELNKLIKDLNSSQSRMEIINKEILEKNKEKDHLKKTRDEIVKKLEGTKQELDHNTSKYNILKNMEQTGEGYSRSVKSIMRACKKDPLLGRGTYGTLADLIKVPKTYEKALEIALGANIQNIITENEEKAKELIDFLKLHNLGRATFLPISSIQGKYIRTNELNIIKRIKGIELALDLIKYDNKFENIFSNLLARVLIASNIDIAIKTSRELQQRFRIVTIEGDLINIGGSLTGGSINTRGNSLLTRKREILELKEAMRKLEEKEKDLKYKYDLLFTSIAKLEEKIVELNGQYQENNFLQIKLKSEIQQLENNIKQIQSMTRQMEGDNKDLLEAKKSTVDKYTSISEKIKAEEVKIGYIKTEVNNIQENLQKEKEDIETLNEMITKDKVKYASKVEQEKSISQEISKLEKTIETNLLLKKEKEKEILKYNMEIEKSIKLKSEKEIYIKEMSKDIIQIQDKIQDYRIKKENLLKLETNKIAILNKIKKITSELKESNHKLDMKTTRLEIQQQSFYNKLWEDYEMTYNKAMEIREKTPNNISMTGKIKDLKNKIKSLGFLNLQAIEEYDDLKERYDFLSNQNEDLKSAQESLVKIIKDIEKKMEKQFMEEFTKIQEKFHEVFIKLFNGGRAQLILEDKEDILNSGIDIIAQPPGKKLQSLSLLSGGERALTAISLLFGILLVKPSPFCVLDEIEAALDDANVDRFANFLREISSQTQFIIITHRKGTMESADILYGTTMAEEGITKILSVNIKDKNKKEIAS